MFLPSAGFHLEATLDSGQAFRWRRTASGWEGMAHALWVRFESVPQGWNVTSMGAADPVWLRRYLRVDESVEEVTGAFPRDPVLLEAVDRWRGLRLLRQDPWECLASFILSSTKQIVQIRQIVELLCSAYGDPLPGEQGLPKTFPGPERVASLSEEQLRACKMGFRAPYLLACARRIAEGRLDLQAVRRMDLDEARAALTSAPGVGPKIADCALLFGWGFEAAFPVDVWVARVLRRFYFKGRDVPMEELRRFARSHFGPRAGYAQQYLFHHIRNLKPHEIELPSNRRRLQSR